MIPDYIETEASLRLGANYDSALPATEKRRLIRRSGIDYAAALNPGPTPTQLFSYISMGENADEPLIGAFEFEIELRACGNCCVLKARAAYLVTPLVGNTAPKRGETMFDMVVVEPQLLLWEHPEDRSSDGTPRRCAAPRWQPAAPGVIPQPIWQQAEDRALSDAYARVYGKIRTHT